MNHYTAAVLGVSERGGRGRGTRWRRGSSGERGVAAVGEGRRDADGAPGRGGTRPSSGCWTAAPTRWPRGCTAAFPCTGGGPASPPPQSASLPLAFHVECINAQAAHLLRSRFFSQHTKKTLTLAWADAAAGIGINLKPRPCSAMRPCHGRVASTRRTSFLCYLFFGASSPAEPKRCIPFRLADSPAPRDFPPCTKFAALLLHGRAAFTDSDGAVASVKLLLDWGIDVNAPDDSGNRKPPQAAPASPLLSIPPFLSPPSRPQVIYYRSVFRVPFAPPSPPICPIGLLVFPRFLPVFTRQLALPLPMDLTLPGTPNPQDGPHCTLQPSRGISGWFDASSTGDGASVQCIPPSAVHQRTHPAG